MVHIESRLLKTREDEMKSIKRLGSSLLLAAVTLAVAFAPVKPNQDTVMFLPAIDVADCTTCCIQRGAICATENYPIPHAYDNGTGPCPPEDHKIVL